MEFTTSYTNHDDLAEATRGVWGKDVMDDCSFVYFGQGIIGIANSTSILDQNCKCKHGDWISIGDKIYFSILKS